MTLEDTMTRYWRAYSAHDLDAVLAHLAEGVLIQFPTNAEPIRGRSSIGRVWSMLFSTVIPDVRQDVLTTVVHDRSVACEFVETGTLTVPGELAESLNLPAGGRPYSMPMASFFHFDDDGLIDRIRSYWDTGSFADQIGIEIGVIRSLQARAHAPA
ncbi:nuclear transport factor 2 family protein [Nonomuraea sediminis]|uniref:nuclear transport factor 2 family protein n=1 Tax=Nonomuraea sediminis TaxID=2835864 RepID=UPI001BDC599D|nr:nuclear transport factor 2 family protein [Nonomuraea sediminis]